MPNDFNFNFDDPQIKALQALYSRNPMTPQMPHLPDAPGFIQNIPFVGQHLQNMVSGFNNNSDAISGRIGNAMLSAAMVPEARGPEGVGGGISRALQGVLGARDYMFKRTMEGAMLPYQMMMPRLQAADILSQINERKEMVPYRQAMERRADAQSDWYAKRVEASQNPKALAGISYDDKGGAWSRIFDSSTGRVRMQNQTGKFLDELPADQQPTFKNEERGNRVATGGYEADLIHRLMSSDPAVAAQAEKEKGIYTDIESNKAYNSGYGHTAGAQNAPHPEDDAKSLVSEEGKHIFDDFKKPPETDFMKWYTNKAAEGTTFKTMQDANKSWLDEQNKYFSDKADRQSAFAEWSRSGAPKQGIGFRQWLKTGKASGGGAMTSSAAPSGNSGSNWTPQ